MSNRNLEPVETHLAKVNGEVAVGEDLAFQRRWWVFERVMWSVFGLIIFAAMLGAFGRGWLANASIAARDGSFYIDYERIERVSAPSMLTIHFTGDGETRVHVSESVVRELGAKRVVPEPRTTALDKGLTYTFPAHGPSTVELALEPAAPGVYEWEVDIDDRGPVRASVVVMP